VIMTEAEALSLSHWLWPLNTDLPRATSAWLTAAGDDEIRALYARLLTGRNRRRAERVFAEWKRRATARGIPPHGRA
jgi:hypothetical protein